MSVEEVMAELRRQDAARAARPRTKLVPCAANCGYKVAVSVDHPNDEKAYHPRCLVVDAEENTLYAQGMMLGHRRRCPGCCGSGVEDSSRWGGDLHLCTWPHRDGQPVSGEEARAATYTGEPHDHMVDAMRYAMQHLPPAQPAKRPIADRWWFWVGVGALLGGLGGVVVGWVWQLF